MGEISGDDVEICLLGAAVIVRDGVRERRYTSDIDRWLLAALALTGSQGVTYTDISRSVRLDKTAARQRISRLQTGSGLEGRIKSIRGTGYWLNLSGVRVDVQEFLRLVETRLSDPDVRREKLRQARLMLVGGLPAFVDYPLPHTQTYARFRDAEQKVGVRGQQILVVDDQIGHKLAERLRRRGDHNCEVATSIDEYRQFENRLDKFDLVIVDRHLERGGYNDRLGDEIVEDISKRMDGVPVMMMTFDVPDELDLTKLQETYGLAGAQRKRTDGEHADLTLLVERVENILLAGPVNEACAAVEKGMVDKRRRAEKRLRRRYPEPTLSRKFDEMTKDTAAVIAIASTNDMEKARIEQRSFVTKWLDGIY